jgi:hypothetical protein
MVLSADDDIPKLYINMNVNVHVDSRVARFARGKKAARELRAAFMSRTSALD